jgi:hypothetical protein
MEGLEITAASTFGPNELVVTLGIRNPRPIETEVLISAGCPFLVSLVDPSTGETGWRQDGYCLDSAQLIRLPPMGTDTLVRGLDRGALPRGVWLVAARVLADSLWPAVSAGIVTVR